MLPERQLSMEGRAPAHPPLAGEPSDPLRGFAARWTERDEERLAEAIREMQPVASLSELVRRLLPLFAGRSEKGMYRHLVGRMEREREFAALVRERMPGSPSAQRGAPARPASRQASASRPDEPQAMVAAAQLLEEHLGPMSRHDAERLAALYRRFGAVQLLMAVASSVVGRMSMLLDEVERRLRAG